MHPVTLCRSEAYLHNDCHAVHVLLHQCQWDSRTCTKLAHNTSSIFRFSISSFLFFSASRLLILLSFACCCFWSCAIVLRFFCSDWRDFCVSSLSCRISFTCIQSIESVSPVHNHQLYLYTINSISFTCTQSSALPVYNQFYQLHRYTIITSPVYNQFYQFHLYTIISFTCIQSILSVSPVHNHQLHLYTINSISFTGTLSLLHLGQTPTQKKRYTIITNCSNWQRNFCTKHIYTWEGVIMSRRPE